jgi:glycosyltransferase involved in cell wall biosynthesis
MRISAVVATCDGAPHVGVQLRSILGQRRPPDEVIVADDASTDGTPGLVEAILGEAPATVATDLIRGAERAGLPGNLERALARASGDVVLFADQDDAWELHKLDVVEARFRRDPALQLLFTDATLIDAEGAVAPGARLWDRTGFTPRRRRAFARDPLGVLLRRTVVTGATMAVRRDLLDAMRPLPREGWHDAWLALGAALRGPTAIAALPAPLIRYRLHGGNLAGVPGRGAWARYGSLRWPREPVLAQWERLADEATATPHATGRLDGAIRFHRRRQTLPAGPAARLPAVVRRLPDYARAPGGVRAAAWDLTSPLVMPDR